MSSRFAGALLFALCLLTTAVAQGAGQPLRVGSKAFAESHVLAEVVAQYLEARGFQVERRLGLGGTLVAFGALEAGDIALYPEYTGTLKQVILGAPDLSSTDLAAALEQRGALPRLDPRADPVPHLGGTTLVSLPRCPRAPPPPGRR